jgi:hypothetical protein
MGGTCSIQLDVRMHSTLYYENLMSRDHWRDLVVDGMIIFS